MSDFVFITSAIGVIVSAIGLVVFIASYAAFFPWRKTIPGRTLMYFVLSLLSLVVVSVLRLIFGIDHVVVALGRSVVFLVLPITTWRLVWVLWHTTPTKPPPKSKERTP